MVDEPPDDCKSNEEFMSRVKFVDIAVTPEQLLALGEIATLIGGNPKRVESLIEFQGRIGIKPSPETVPQNSVQSDRCTVAIMHFTDPGMYPTTMVVEPQGIARTLHERENGSYTRCRVRVNDETFFFRRFLGDKTWFTHEVFNRLRQYYSEEDI
ncbi:MAG: hypothetical protein WBB28_20725 [Crinalium sp.]